MNLRFFSKLCLSLLLAFIVSQLLVTKVTFKESPVLKPSFQQFVHNLPTKIADQTKKTLSFFSHLPLLSHLSPRIPPPWIEPVIKPTIVAYKPPVYYPPTSTPKPLRPTTPPNPTPTPFIPTVTPTLALSPSKGPSPTRSPYPTLTPTPSLFSSPTPPHTPTPQPPTDSPPSQKKNELLNLINQERQKNGTASLNYHGALNTAAQAHADDMVQNNYFSHIGRDGSTPADRAERTGYGSRAVGENIAKGTINPSSIFSMWMGSSGHRQNMLNPGWKSAGIGFSGTTWVLMLGVK